MGNMPCLRLAASAWGEATNSSSARTAWAWPEPAQTPPEKVVVI
jgi:hypothetical protein